MFGENSTINVMEGYIRRMWGKHGIDKIVVVSYGVFMLLFLAMKSRDKIVNGSRVFFDNKPVFMKPWFEGFL